MEVGKIHKKTACGMKLDIEDFSSYRLLLDNLYMHYKDYFGMPGVTDAFREKLANQLRPLAMEAMVRAMNEEEFLEQCAKIYRQRNLINGGEQLC